MGGGGERRELVQFFPLASLRSVVFCVRGSLARGRGGDFFFLGGTIRLLSPRRGGGEAREREVADCTGVFCSIFVCFYSLREREEIQDSRFLFLTCIVIRNITNS